MNTSTPSAASSQSIDDLYRLILADGLPIETEGRTIRYKVVRLRETGVVHEREAVRQAERVMMVKGVPKLLVSDSEFRFALTGRRGQSDAFRITDKLRTKVAFQITRAGRMLTLGRDLLAEFDAFRTASANSNFKATGGRAAAVVLRDANRKAPVIITRRGRTLILGRDVLVEIDALKAAGFSNKYISPSINALGVGDSLTQGGSSWFGQLATRLTVTGRTFTNVAVGGTTSSQQAGRIGAFKFLLSLQNNKFLGAGSTVVTASQVFSPAGALVTVWPITSQSASTLRGRLQGVLGTLTATVFDGNGLPTSMTFTPDFALGADRWAYAQIPFESVLADGHDFDLVLAGVGRNNITDPATIKRDFLAITGWQKTIEKRVIVVTPPNWPGETTGTGNWNNVVAVEQWAQQTFGECAVLARPLLIANANLSDPDDAADVASGLIPRSLRNSSIDGHYNATGHGLISDAVAAIINRKGF